MTGNKTERSKNITSKLPRNLKPFYEEMDLIDRFASKLAEYPQGRYGFEGLSQVLEHKYDDGVDFYLFKMSESEEQPTCMLARVAGQVKQDPELQIPALVEKYYDQVMQQKSPLLLPTSLAENSSSALLVPMMDGQQMIGLIYLQSRQGEPFTNQAPFFLSGLAQIVAPAIMGSKQKYRFSEVYDLMVEAWGRAVDQHKGALEGHCLRVADLTRRFAIRIGVRGERLTSLWRGAMLHDLGKLGISDTILFKESALDLKEWEEMRRHPTFAYDIIRRVAFLKDSQDIPYAHHEKWDGTGYPRGLRGEEIPLVARIYALVDVWDALLSQRPYRSAWKKETAVEFLRNNLGSHFDPVLGAEFLRMIEEESLG